MNPIFSRENQIIAIGWTKIDQGRIRFGSNRHIMINAGQSVGHSAAIHELMDSDVATGVPLETGLKALFKAASGRIWLFHHAALVHIRGNRRSYAKHPWVYRLSPMYKE